MPMRILGYGFTSPGKRWLFASQVFSLISCIKNRIFCRILFLIYPSLFLTSIRLYVIIRLYKMGESDQMLIAKFLLTLPIGCTCYLLIDAVVFVLRKHIHCAKLVVFAGIIALLWQACLIISIWFR